MIEEKDPKDYEISFLGKTEADKAGVVRVVVQNGGQVFYEGPLEHIALTYKIKGETSAYFGYVHAKIPAQHTKALREQLRASPSLLRFLILTPPLQKPKKWVPRVGRPTAEEEAMPERKKPEALPLSNEALEKKIEEILQ